MGRVLVMHARSRESPSRAPNDRSRERLGGLLNFSYRRVA